MQVTKEENLEKLEEHEDVAETETLEEEDDCVPSYNGVEELGLDEFIPENIEEDEQEAGEKPEGEQVESLDETEHVLPQKVLKLDRLDGLIISISN